MSDKGISHEYLNDLVFDLKSLWDERGRGCRCMMEVGREIYESDCKSRIRPEIPAIISAVGEVLKEMNVIGSVSFEQEDLPCACRYKAVSIYQLKNACWNTISNHSPAFLPISSLWASKTN